MSTLEVFKKGTMAILSVLHELGGKASETNFLKSFCSKPGLYYMLYNRYRADLLQYHLIDYSVDKFEKIVILTDKGRSVAEHVIAIEKILNESSGNAELDKKGSS